MWRPELKYQKNRESKELRFLVVIYSQCMEYMPPLINLVVCYVKGPLKILVSHALPNISNYKGLSYIRHKIYGLLLVSHLFVTHRDHLPEFWNAVEQKLLFKGHIPKITKLNVGFVPNVLTLSCPLISNFYFKEV